MAVVSFHTEAIPPEGANVKGIIGHFHKEAEGPIRFGKTGARDLEIPMTKCPKPKQAPMTNSQVPDKQAPGIFLEIGPWDLGFDWDLGTWSLGF